MLLSVGQVTEYRHLCASEHWTDHRTDHRTLDRLQNILQDGLRNRLLDTADKLNSYSQWSGQLDLIIVLVCLVKSTPVDCNHYC